MPLSPKPPNPILLVARWMRTSLIQPPPKPQREVTSREAFFVAGEEVEGQWMSHRVDLCYRASQRFVGEDRKYRSEDLLLHDRIVESYVIKDRWFDLKCFTAGTATADGFGRIDQAVDTVEMFFVDDLPVIPVFQRFFAVLAADLAAKFCNQCVFDLRVAVI
mgnify:CR=1 FL=1